MAISYKKLWKLLIDKDMTVAGKDRYCAQYHDQTPPG